MSGPWEKEIALALRAAVEGGRIALERPHDLAIRSKESARDVVTPVDIAVECKIRELLAESGYRVIGEEQGAGETRFPLPDANPVWVVDPIDGTANYVNGLEYYAISVGLCRQAQFSLGVVCMPKAGELFFTLAEDRALLNGRPLVHEHRSIGNALIAAGFSGKAARPEQRQLEYQLYGHLNDATRGCLRLGSAASNICLVAAGRLQAAYGLNGKLWDVAGALSVAIAAGCKAVVGPSKEETGIDYIVGSRDVVDMIHESCRSYQLIGERCAIW